MKYSNSRFPIENDSLVDTLRRIWMQGWLDNFSESHFLIRAINGQWPDFRTIDQMNAVSPELYSDCDTSYNFVVNFSQRLQRFICLCGPINSKRFLDQLSAGKNNYNEDQFFEALHEMHVFSYLTSYGAPNVEYEPALGGVSGERNPEYRIRNRFAVPSQDPDKPLIPMEDYILDVEVKSIVGNVDAAIDLTKSFITPIVTIDYKNRNQLNTFCNERGFQVELPDVIHLRDFLNETADKFETPTNENHFNILYLNWTYREIPLFNFMEPLSLLDNTMNGLLRHKAIGIHFGISEDVFEKVSAIFIYSYPKQALAFSDIRWVFANNKCAVLFNPNLSQKQILKLTHILHMGPSANPKTPVILSHPPVTSTMDALALSNLAGIEEVIIQILFKDKPNEQ